MLVFPPITDDLNKTRKVSEAQEMTGSKAYSLLLDIIVHLAIFIILYCVSVGYSPINNTNTNIQQQ